MDDNIINPTSKRNPARFRGPLISQDYNESQEAVVQDIYSISAAVNSLNARLNRGMAIMQNENAYLRRKVDALEEGRIYGEQVAAELGTQATRLVDFSRTEGISFPNALDDSNSAMLSAEYGEVTLPPNNVENKFYVLSLRDNKIVPPADLRVTVNGTFDKADGNGLIDYERGGRVLPGDPKFAFNGVNNRYWVRKVEFPLYSRVDQVEVELTVTVPEGTSTQANTLEVIPFPNGSVDVTELATASDLGNNFTRVEGFAPKDNFVADRYHFPATTVDQVRIRLRQRNWVEENGKKVFYYGLQELGLKLIDYDKSYSQGAPFGNNNSFIVVIPAPSNYLFTSITRIDPFPNFFLEDPANRHVHVRLGTNIDPSVGSLWDSDLDYQPQNTESIQTSTETLYAFVELNYVEESGGLLSPFPVGTTPFLKALGFTFTLGSST